MTFTANLIIAGIMVMIPTSSVINQLPKKTEYQLFNSDYRHYDTLVHDVPSACKLIELNEKLDKLYLDLKSIENANKIKPKKNK